MSIPTPSSPSGYAFDIASGDDVLQGFPPHFHEDYAVAVTSRGAHRLRVGRRVERVPAGAIVTLNPLELHAADPSPGPGWSYRMLYIPLGTMRAASASSETEGPRLPMFRRALLVHDGLAQRLIDLFSARVGEGSGRTGSDPQSSLALDVKLRTTLHELVRRHADGSAADGMSEPRGRFEHRACALVREYLHAHLASAIRLATLAALAGLNPHYLVRIFRATVGVPPHTYLTRLRVARAQRLLSAGGDPASVALQVGFSDQSHLNRHFKRALGTTPGCYAKMNRR